MDGKKDRKNSEQFIGGRDTMKVEFLKMSEKQGVKMAKHSPKPEVQRQARYVEKNDEMNEFECGE